jgi:hypothetical protein
MTGAGSNTPASRVPAEVQQMLDHVPDGIELGKQWPQPEPPAEPAMNPSPGPTFQTSASRDPLDWGEDADW